MIKCFVRGFEGSHKGRRREVLLQDQLKAKQDNLEVVEATAG